MTITESRSENLVQLNLDGRVDTTTAPQLQAAILNAFQKSKNVILDMHMVNYVSSAGLRAFLIGHKTAMSKGGSMVVTGVTPEVMQILETTGFDSILNIR